VLVRKRRLLDKLKLCMLCDEVQIICWTLQFWTLVE